MEKTAKKRNWFLAFFDDKSKTNLKWWNRNYFYAGTILIVVINILIFAFVNKNPWDIVGYKPNEGSWTSVFYLTPTLSLFLSSLFHSNWQHVLLNMLCFFVAGIYLERKFGTFGLLGFVLFAAYISAIAIGANDLSVYSVGYSGVNYFIYSTIILDYFFSFQKHRRNKTNTVLGAIVVALIYLAMCFSGGTEKFSFAFWPYDLAHNMAHYTSFIAGGVLALFVEAVRFASLSHALKQAEIRKQNSVSGIVIIDTTEEKPKKRKRSKKDKKQKEQVKEEGQTKSEEKVALGKVEEKPEKTENAMVEEKVVQKEEKPQPPIQEKKVSAIPEELKTAPVKRTYKKKKKTTTNPNVLVIKPVVGKQTTKKDDKK